MKTSKVIEKLQELIKEHGDLEFVYDDFGQLVYNFTIEKIDINDASEVFILE